MLVGVLPRVIEVKIEYWIPSLGTSTLATHIYGNTKDLGYENIMVRI